MKFTFNWLKELVDLPAGFTGNGEEGPHAVAKALTMAGLEVESLSPFGRVPGVVVGLVTEVCPHPQTDRLFLVTVDTR
ncbi:MAG: hypothetical protein O6837_09880, partial [Deltaproteobacteria bacterium]|nr:hypothetical protein [Deltaproteobacteria bacterium]